MGIEVVLPESAALIALLVGSCFGAAFISIPSTIAAMFGYMIFVGIPFTRARKKVISTSDRAFLTKEVVEQEIAQQYPRLYKISTYGPMYLLGFGLVVHVAVVVVVMATALVNS